MDSLYSLFRWGELIPVPAELRDNLYNFINDYLFFNLLISQSKVLWSDYPNIIDIHAFEILSKGRIHLPL